VNVAFVLGLSKNETLNSKVREENEKFGDIIQGDFYDAYRNLSFKSIIQWRWSMYNCRNARFFGKIDDDVFLNTPLLLRTLASKTFTDPSLIGNRSVTEKAVPTRNILSKFYVSEEYWPGQVYKTYKTFYVMTSHLAKGMYEEIYNTRG
jgi:beta-1,3-galactosyltransferase 1